MGRSYNPYDHADELELKVIHRPLRTANEMWLPEHNIIVIKSGMRAVHDRSALAHGVGHAVYGHCDDRQKHEIQADRFAGTNLIDLDECLDVMRVYPDSARLAHELGVTTRILRTYLNVRQLTG